MHAIGVDIGGTKIAVGVVDEAGRILAKVRRDTVADDVASIDRAIADACTELAREHEVGAIGLAAAGFVSPDRSSVLFAPNIAWREYPLAQRVGDLLDLDVPVVVENDANAAGWAEFRFGAARAATDMIMLTVGTGLGGAVVVDRELVRGKWGVAAEVGHMRVVPGGHYCGCGHEGCWEQYASGSALVRDARQAAVANRDAAARLLELAGGDREAIQGPHVTQAAQEGDPLAIDLLANLGRWIGEGAASVAALLDPELFVIGGGVGAAGDLLLLPIRKAYEAQLSALGHRPVAQVELAQHANEAGIVGAADLARR
ncbi:MULTISPECIES: ROK family glucokinase [Isoptericola]|uniref:Glucokinase n=1 Tax=Isoptericola sediminis TaxID=2733572 RepID=A0A849K975_9MICO|nr:MULTISPECIES: ROK family glucokinase [Isoptericola]MDO8145204.1 ROK family glucokinase [Isoptericola sp. 178]MDO8148842.1 ROK family glucokinase [Isoptericola sp. b515]MDO8151216.1 ROK family glucokinase [Isoptericola sp. b408]NNU28559.1 ROK family glucokinase [Isoptericola sediminis]